MAPESSVWIKGGAFLIPGELPRRGHGRRRPPPPLVNETDWYNSLVLGTLLLDSIWSSLPHFARAWLRNYVSDLLPTSSLASSGASTFTTGSAISISPKVTTFDLVGFVRILFGRGWLCLLLTLLLCWVGCGVGRQC